MSRIRRLAEKIVVGLLPQGLQGFFKETYERTKALADKVFKEISPGTLCSSEGLRPKDLADLPAASRRYLLRVNRILLKRAQEGKRRQYLRLARQLMKRSKSLSLWAALHQIAKDGARGSGPDLRRITRAELMRLMRNMSSGPRIRSLLSRRAEKVIWIIKKELSRKPPQWFPPYIATKSYIPKPGTEELRPLTFPAMIDRARETKILFVILPQARLRYNVDESVGFWPNMDRIRGLMSFMSRAIAKYGPGNYELLSVDIAKYFGSIPEDGRRALTAALWIPRTYQEYIIDNMTCPYYDSKDKKFHLWPEGKASSEGSVLLPTLANMYLFKYDCMLKGLGVIFCRYADNMVFALPTAGLRSLPWHLPAAEFIDMYIQPHMPKGVVVHRLDKPAKTHIIDGHLELGIYLDPKATGLDVVMRYGDRTPEELDRILYKTPILSKFVKEWHTSFPGVKPCLHNFRAQRHLNDAGQEILRIQLDVDAPMVYADRHEVTNVLSDSTPKFLSNMMPSPVSQPKPEKSDQLSSAPKLEPGLTVEKSKESTVVSPDYPEWSKKYPHLPYDVWQYTIGRKIRARDVSRGRRKRLHV